jgi:hypothetical protein
LNIIKEIESINSKLDFIIEKIKGEKMFDPSVLEQELNRATALVSRSKTFINSLLLKIKEHESTIANVTNQVINSANVVSTVSTISSGFTNTFSDFEEFLNSISNTTNVTSTVTSNVVVSNLNTNNVSISNVEITTVPIVPVTITPSVNNVTESVNSTPIPTPTPIETSIEPIVIKVGDETITQHYIGAEKIRIGPLQQ